MLRRCSAGLSKVAGALLTFGTARIVALSEYVTVRSPSSPLHPCLCLALPNPQKQSRKAPVPGERRDSSLKYYLLPLLTCRAVPTPSLPSP